jgi:alkylated DNA repair dioxygenase AlkB
MTEQTLVGFEQFFGGSPFPAEYTPNFLTPNEADDFYAFFNDWHYCDYKIVKSGLILKRKGVAFAADPNHTQVRGTKASGVTYGAMDTENDDDDCNDNVLPLTRDEKTPAVLLSLQAKLTAKLRTMVGYEQRTVNYLSVVRYPDETAGIGWHQHSEDNGVDTPVLIVSVGAVRPFHLRVQKDRSQKWEHDAEHGSLIVLPSSFNNTHEHAILKEKRACGVRISVNTKCLTRPKVFSLKDGWGHYPRWAVYVGCRYEANGKLVKEGTPYGNGTNPSAGRAGAIKTEAAFRKYVDERMSEPAFRAKAIADLRGKHLLCWCRQSGPERAEFCHARVWLDAVNQETAKSASSSGK